MSSAGDVDESCGWSEDCCDVDAEDGSASEAPLPTRATSSTAPDAIVIEDSPQRLPVGDDSDSDDDDDELPNPELVRRLGECCLCMLRPADAVLGPCAHSFCRPCIHRWWQVSSHRQCPLCKRWPRTLVQTQGEADAFTIIDLATDRPVFTSPGARDTMRAAVYHGQLCVAYDPRLHVLQFPPASGAGHVSIERHASGLADTAKWWAQHGHTGATPGRVAAWLRRDLVVVLGTTETQFAETVVMGICARLPLLSLQATRLLMDYLGPSARHVLYELSMYLRSGPLEIGLYDLKGRWQEPLAAVLLDPSECASGGHSARTPSHRQPSPSAASRTAISIGGPDRGMTVTVRVVPKKRNLVPAPREPPPKRVACTLLAHLVD